MKFAILLSILLLTACTGPGSLPSYSVAPEFQLTERSGRSIARQDLKDQVWIADFIFTHCSGICPAMSSNMERLQAMLPREIRLVSFSVDPTNDTPDVLTEYAQRYHADPERWLFLTGEPEAIQSLSVSGFKLALDPSAGTEAEPIMHSSRFVLIDREGHIRGYYGTEDENALNRLIADAKKLL